MTAEVIELSGIRHSTLSKLVAISLRFEAAYPEKPAPILLAIDAQEKEELERIILCMAKAHKTRITVEIDADAPTLVEPA